MKRLLLVAAAVSILAGGGLLAFVLYREHQARDVRGSSTVEFVTTDVPKERPIRVPPDIPWPTYGYDERRLRVAPYRLRPPYRRIWRFRARTLLEFPPAIGHGRLYFANAAGTLFAVNTRTGRRAWRYRARRCVAASPAMRGGTVYMTFLNRPPCNREGDRLDGELVALAAGDGDVRWRKEIGPSESSPLVHRGLLYVGDWRGIVYCFVARSGELKWTFRTKGEVKGALAAAGNRLFVGSYDHRVYALNATTGKLLWRAATQKRLGPRGRFYSTPAVAYGRVYIGATDGKVYSYGATTGKLRWSQGTGDFVYSSPAVWRQRVFVGSYNGRFYALDAATGDVRWSFRANGPISGSATIIDGLVYFATLKRKTYALDARNGRPVWSYPDGKYSPIVTDGERLYLVGYARLYALRQRRSLQSSGRDRAKRAEKPARPARGRRARRRAGS